MSRESEEVSTKKESAKDFTATQQFDILVRFGNSSGKSRGSSSILDALFKNVWQPSPNRHNTEWEACMDKKKTRVILIIYFYDKEHDIVSAIVKFLLI